jgi:hypothetical protein
MGEVGEPRSGSPGGGQGSPCSQPLGVWRGAAPTLPSPTLRAGEGFVDETARFTPRMWRYQRTRTP